MKRNKSGISLIVLVITIIVMVILAAAIIISLDNAGVINKANDAVQKTDLKQVQHLAALAWSEAYIDGKRGEALEDAVLDKLEDYTDKYNIVVTDKGVTVDKENEKALNDYGFYYDVPYVDVNDAAIFKQNETVEWYAFDEEVNSWIQSRVEDVIYEKGKIILAGFELIVSEGGKTLTHSLNSEAKLTYSELEYHDVYYGGKYWRTDPTDDHNYGEDHDCLSVDADNTINFYRAFMNENDNEERILDISLVDTVSVNQTMKDSHVFFEKQGPFVWIVSMDGKTIVDPEGVTYVLLEDDELLVTCGCKSKICKFEVGMTWEEWINSPYNTVNATIDEYGEIRFNFCNVHNHYCYHNNFNFNKDIVITGGGKLRLEGAAS